MLNTKNSDTLFSESKTLLSGGVNSPVRAFNNVDLNPIVIDKSQGKYLIDVDGNKYLDFVNSWGANILGHANKDVVDKVKEQSELGFSYGAASRLEIECAKLVKELMPNIELMRMVSTGTEACMSTIRLARGYTKKNKIIKFIGCYHGHSDSLLSRSGSGLLTHSLPNSAGIPNEFVKHTINVPFNDSKSLKQVFENFKDDVAAVIVEPIQANMNLVLPEPGFLGFIREICSFNNSLLIFDEVITGFRVALGGAQELYKIQPDLTCLGKIVGGGLPAAIFGGKKEIMECLAPIGDVYQAGTLSGNPLAMAAGIATLNTLKNNKSIYKEFDSLGKLLKSSLKEIFVEKNILVESQAIGGLFALKFLDDKTNIIFKKYFKHMLDNGVYLPPSAYEVMFLSVQHTLKDIKHFLELSSQFNLE